MEDKKKKKFIVDDQFWRLFPEAQIDTLTLRGIDNHDKARDHAYFQQLLDEAARESEQFMTEGIFRKNPVVDQWRQAYRQFKTKKGARSSIEALLKRVDQGRSFSPIFPLVDIYNSISLRYGVPAGGEDLNAIQGNLHLGEAKGGEDFFPHGAEENSPALPGEVIYYDDQGAVCRCFNWREAQRTELTESTTDSVLVIESINAEQAKRADEAIEALHQLCKERFKVPGHIQKVTRDNREIQLIK
ncbi:MAG: phenylalanine--tRNA ligase beta subunit-related protein [Lentilactobacillus hilgardii]